MPVFGTGGGGHHARIGYLASAIRMSGTPAAWAMPGPDEIMEPGKNESPAPSPASFRKRARLIPPSRTLP
jgi:hypothetical protein